MARRILATSGGFVPGPVQQSVRPGAMLIDALTRTGATRPRVTFILTASGDDRTYATLLYDAFGAVGCDVRELRLFPQPSARPLDALVGTDLVWVGGGSVANLLALWQLHGVDDALLAAYQEGTILAGVSAGSICWHVGGTTDSFGPELRAVTNGLAIVPYGNGVHYDSEAQRRPLLHQLVAGGTLPTSYATDDHVGLWYHDEAPVEVVADQDVPPDGPAAYRVEAVGGAARETRLPVGPVR